MSLYSIETQQMITHTPHKKEFDAWCARLSEDQLEVIRSRIRSMIDSDNSQIHTSSWMPGSNWEGTEWESIYSVACQYDANAAGLCFGFLVWEAFLEHPDVWAFGRYEIDGRQIRGLTYFRVDP